MSLNDLELEQIAKIKNINCNNILKNRLYSLWITKGALIKVEKKTLTNSTLKININDSKIAIRANEAAQIEVEYEK